MTYKEGEIIDISVLFNMDAFNDCIILGIVRQELAREDRRDFYDDFVLALDSAPTIDLDSIESALLKASDNCQPESAAMIKDKARYFVRQIDGLLQKLLKADNLYRYESKRNFGLADLLVDKLAHLMIDEINPYQSDVKPLVLNKEDKSSELTDLGKVCNDPIWGEELKKLSEELALLGEEWECYVEPDYEIPVQYEGKAMFAPPMAWIEVERRVRDWYADDEAYAGFIEKVGLVNKLSNEFVAEELTHEEFISDRVSNIIMSAIMNVVQESYSYEPLSQALSRKVPVEVDRILQNIEFEIVYVESEFSDCDTLLGTAAEAAQWSQDNLMTSSSEKATPQI